jgi:hypothetical protein
LLFASLREAPGIGRSANARSAASRALYNRSDTFHEEIP